MAITDYPEHNYAKKSLFTLAYLYSNQLEMYTDAYNMYNQFIAKYPNDDLVDAARYEIENLTTHMNVINDFLEQTGMDLVERTDKVLEVSERIDAADVKDLFFRETHSPNDVKKIVSFVIYTKPGIFSDVQKYADNLNIT